MGSGHLQSALECHSRGLLATLQLRTYGLKSLNIRAGFRNYLASGTVTGGLKHFTTPSLLFRSRISLLNRGLSKRILASPQ